MVATMNPGSDFGKKELSPALRNRMTEIWVESYFSQEQLLNLNKSKIEPVLADVNVPKGIDLHLIITNLCMEKLEKVFAAQVS
jgi:midasin (ATPase involved in ribosome maturation)